MPKQTANAELFSQDALYQKKKSVLLRTAAECFNTLGFKGTSLKYLAQQLNLTDAALYYYVSSKDELVFLCYEKAFELGERTLERAIRDGANGREIIKLFIEYGIEVMVGEEGPVAVISEIPSLSAKYRDGLMDRAARHTGRVTEQIRKGVADGSIAPCNAVLVCEVILGSLDWLPKWYRPEAGYDVEEVKRAYTQTILLGLDAKS
jgi:AcrR family transcriptional regulator